ncbi:MAG: UDP-N-acetylmuramoyl-L-alanyl-D-glutamate--2,6-diaminopimelate ligase [Betaproteobacteria bacterium]
MSTALSGDVGVRPSLSRSAITALNTLPIRRLVTDSRAVQPGDTFVAFPGEVRDGRHYIGQAIARGAASVLWERRGFAWDPAWKIPNYGVLTLRRRAGEIASQVYGRPSAKLWMIGVTGTNGKTSCSHWIAHSLTRTGRKCPVIGTLGSGFPGRLDPTPNTTPDAVTLHGALRDFLRDGARAASMEVSSHGLVQHRLSGVEFDVALLTNLTRDHLDYHGTMRAYRAAKARLFGWPTLKWAVLNLDDAFGAELATRIDGAGARVIGYGLGSGGKNRIGRFAQVQGRNLRIGPEGLSLDVCTPWGNASLSSALIGRFNAANLLATLAVLLASDTGLDDAVQALAQVRALPGRTERHGGGRAPLVVIDYAHTPDALQQVLSALRETMNARRARTTARKAARPHQPKLFCVFGCGGERDRGKRPLMGAVASRLADLTVITSDNPRGENPLSIIDDIARGTLGEVIVEPDRARAVRLAVRMARPRDIVLVAGKGHERYQEVRGVKQPYSDAAEVTAALRTRSAAPCR